MAIEATHMATGLDIWELIKEEVPFERERMLLEDLAIDTCELYLRVEGGSYVEIDYYDINLIEEDPGEEPSTKRFDLSVEEVGKMYSKIRQVVDLPLGVHTLHTYLEKEMVTYFDVRMVTFFK